MIFQNDFDDGRMALRKENSMLCYGFQTHLPRDVFIKNKDFVPYDSEIEIKSLCWLTPCFGNNEYDFKKQEEDAHTLMITRADKSLFKFSKELLDKYLNKEK
jgi:hypothetical protein